MENTVKPEELKYLIDNDDDVLILDVRRRQDYEDDPDMISGAKWYDYEELEQWGAEIPADRRVVVYCLKGGALSKMVVEFLQKRKVDTCYLEGGITAWKAVVLGQQVDTSAACSSCCLVR